MYPDRIRTAQRILRQLAGYDGAIDGDPGPATLAAATRIAAAFPRYWPPERIVIGAAQVLLEAHGYAPGPIDGLWGPQTDAAAEIWAADRTQAPFSRPAPTSRRGGGPWPDEADLRSRFGPPGSPACTEGRVRVPWRMVLAWDSRTEIGVIRCHADIAASLGRVLEAVADTHTPAQIDALGLNRFGGCYNARRKRGGTSWSTHAWGIALDFDPGRNRLRWGADRARLALPDADAWWQTWEAEGWHSLGRDADFDWMHVQAARP